MSPTGSRCLFVCRGSERENSSRDSPGRFRAQDFDPLGLKPEDPAEFAEMATKEIQNGRVAMLAIAGFVAQELVDGKPILLNDFGI